VILLYGQLDDEPLTLALAALQGADARYALLAQDALEHEDLRLDLGPSGVEGALTIAGEVLPLQSIRAIYARPLARRRRGLDAASEARAERLGQLICEWLDVAPGLVINRPAAMQSNASKPLQAQLLGAAGFAVPATLVSNDPEEVIAFWRRHGRIIYKSTSGVRSIVKELDEQAATRLDRIRALPTQFQELVPGVDLRVHVVGDRAFAARIESPVVDYRYAAREGREAALSAVELPAEVAARCVAVARQMDLPLAGIDLRRRPDGAFVCFEVNPMPAYSFFEARTGLPISHALAQALIEADGAPPVGRTGKE
jgi:hypothetical protein